MNNYANWKPTEYINQLALESAKKWKWEYPVIFNRAFENASNVMSLQNKVHPSTLKSFEYLSSLHRTPLMLFILTMTRVMILSKFDFELKNLTQDALDEFYDRAYRLCILEKKLVKDEKVLDEIEKFLNNFSYCIKTLVISFLIIAVRTNRLTRIDSEFYLEGEVETFRRMNDDDFNSGGRKRR